MARRHCWRKSQFLAKFVVCSCFSIVFMSFSAARALLQNETTSARSSSPSCRHPMNVSLLVHVPCLQDDDGTASWRERLDSCDLLAEVAMDMAIDRANRLRDGGFLANSSVLTREFLFSGLSTNNTDIGRGQQLRDGFRFITSNDYFGVIGPSDSGEAAFWAPLFYRAELITVSYEATGTEADRTAFSFYRTLPSDLAANIGRINLIARFEWFRIATISSQERHYVQISENFIFLYNKFLEENDGVLGGVWAASYSNTSSLSALNGVQRNGISIIFGFFSEEDARQVLCKAYFMGLVSKDHAWILPSYYNPNWWRLPSGATRTSHDGGCSDEDMEDILESVIFVGSVKYPPMDMSLGDFHRQLIAKSLDLFPSLTEEDLKPYLLRSRATNAYDAVTLLAKSVGVALRQDGDSCDIDFGVLQAAMENVFMECEYCRLNAECFLNATETERCQDLCGLDYVSVSELSTYPACENDELRSTHILNFYGQVAYTQFLDGEECLVGLYWNFTSGDNFYRFAPHIYSLEELNRLPCARRLNLSKDDFVTRNSRCPLTFKWKGITGPPSSDHVIRHGYSEYHLVLAGLTTGFGLAISVLLLVFNIVWRKNKTVKASSPWLNVVLIAGNIIHLPGVLVSIFAVSTVKYNFVVEAMHPLCHFVYMRYLGDIIFISALIMKNWRLYRIFNNRALKLIGKKLTDQRLSIGILLFSLPVVVVLIAMFSSNVRLDVVNLPSKNLQFHTFAYCTLDNFRIYKILLDVYITCLLVVLLMISFLASLANLLTFRHEALLSLRAVTVALVPIASLYIVHLFLDLFFNVGNLEGLFWIVYSSELFLSTVVLVILFGPNVFVVLRNHMSQRRTITMSTNSQKDKNSVELVTRYHQLIKERATLKAQLCEVNEKVANILKDSQRQIVPPNLSLIEAHPLPLPTEVSYTESGDKCQSDVLGENSDRAVCNEPINSQHHETPFTIASRQTTRSKDVDDEGNASERKQRSAQPGGRDNGSTASQICTDETAPAAVVIDHNTHSYTELNICPDQRH